MAASYDAAVARLYQAPLDQFVGLRKQLAADLKSSGDATAAAQLSKLGRPPISAWAVNQLWWQERDAFEQLFATAERVRKGELAGVAAHREALTTLRAHAAKLIIDAGHAATEATLRRVGTTLASLAAAGSFEPDGAGALAGDRDPPGFEEGGFSGAPPRTPAPRHYAEPERATPRARDGGTKREADAPAAKHARDQAKRQKEAEAAARKHAEAEAEAEAERRRVEDERKKVRAERRRLEAALRVATEELGESARTVERLRRELAKAEQGLEAARQAVRGVESELLRLPELD